MRKSVAFVVFLLYINTLSAQTTLQSEVYENDEYLENFDTTTFEIKDYIRYTPLLGGQAVRMKNNRPASGLIKDLWPNGSLKHKGYYANGRLTSSYKNFFPNGTLEREYKAKGTNGALYDLYYSNGKHRLHMEYRKGVIIEYIEYYPNGNTASHEKYLKDGERYEFYFLYYADGTKKLKMLPEDKKHTSYTVHIYWENGKLKQEGKKYYSTAEMSYLKNGTWQLYTREGKLLRTEDYELGELIR